MDKFTNGKEYNNQFTQEELNNEVWKDIQGYEGLYKVSSLGRVKNKRGLIMSPKIHHRGYIQIGLYKDKKSKNLYIHRLVAQAFIPNPDNLPYVNHKDENKLNDRADNLEWCTPEYNNSYGDFIKKSMQSAKPLYQLDMNGNIIKEFNSAHQVQKVLGYNRRAIIGCCEGNCKTAYGYIWKYK